MGGLSTCSGALVSRLGVLQHKEKGHTESIPKSIHAHVDVPTDNLLGNLAHPQLTPAHKPSLSYLPLLEYHEILLYLDLTV